MNQCHFLRANMIAFVILLRVLARISLWRGEVLTSFNENNRVSIFGKKKIKRSVPGYYLTARNVVLFLDSKGRYCVPYSSLGSPVALAQDIIFRRKSRQSV